MDIVAASTSMPASGIGFLLGLACFVLLFIAVSSGASTTSVLWIVLGGVAGVSLVLRLARRRTRGVDQQFIDAARADPTGLPDLLKGGGPFEQVNAWRIPELLARADLGGIALRVVGATQDPGDPVVPIMVPFEPIPLDEASPTFRELASPASGPDGDPAGLRIVESDWMATWRQTRRMWRMGLIGSLITTTWFGVAVWLGGFHLINLLVFAMCSLGTCLAAYRFLTGVPNHVFPGGFIDTQRRRVYRRERGMLIWYPRSGLLRISEKGSAKVNTAGLTRAEGLLAIRAWLSPLPPPSDEMIEAFLAGRQ